jgi:HK97 family phage prohead protease
MLERRVVKSGYELRASQGDEGAMVISGMAARFGQISEPLENFREILQRGCFQRSLQSDRDIRCNFSHDQSQILGRRKNGTLTLAENDQGLLFRCLLPDTQAARDVYHLIVRRDLADCSFEFSVDGPDGDEWGECEDPEDRSRRVPLRTIKRANLYAVSVVGSPAYQNTSVSTEPGDTVWSGPTPRGLPFFFPEGIPETFSVELRSKILSTDRQSSNLRQSRKNLMHLMLS